MSSVAVLSPNQANYSSIFSKSVLLSQEATAQLFLFDYLSMLSCSTPSDIIPVTTGDVMAHLGSRPLDLRRLSHTTRC